LHTSQRQAAAIVWSNVQTAATLLQDMRLRLLALAAAGWGGGQEGLQPLNFAAAAAAARPGATGAQRLQQQ
jgi:hypothetical protein